MIEEDEKMDPMHSNETEKNEEDAKDLNAETSSEESMADADAAEKTFDELKEENEVLSEKMMRALAETENIRKKFFKEKRDAEIYGGTRLARDLLTVLDNLNRALESVDDEMKEKQNAFLEGIELTKKTLDRFQDVDGLYTPDTNDNGEWDWEVGRDRKKESLKWLL